MGKLTHTVKGPIASFRSADKANIESLKLHFLPKQEGSGDPSPTNIRPITGWMGCNLYGAGTNIWDEEWELGAFSNYTGQKTSSSSCIRSKNYIPCKPSTSYYLRHPIQNNDCHLYFYDKNKNFIDHVWKWPGSFTTPDNCYYIRFYMHSSYGTTYLNNIGINYPAKMVYVASVGKKEIELSWSDHGTEYGGYIDPVKGKLVAEYKAHVFNGEENISNYSGTFTGGIRLINDTLDDCTGVGALTKCDKAALESTIPSDITRLGIRIGGGVYKTYFYVPDSMFDGEATVDKFKAWLAENNMTVVAKLTTPIEYDIDPISLQTFLDYNNFWSDTNDDTEVEYAFADRLSERKLIMDTPHIESASGAVASFNTDMKAPIVDLKAHFTPVQEGSGDPSPVNKRPIHGWTGANIQTSGKNLLNTMETSFLQSHSTTVSPGRIDTTDVGTGNSNFIKFSQVFGVGTYTISGKCSGPGVKAIRMLCSSQIADSYWNDYYGAYFIDYLLNNKHTFTLNKESTLGIVFVIAEGHEEASIYDLQVEKGSVATEYEEYSGETVPIEFPATKNLLNSIATNIIPFKNTGYANYVIDNGTIVTTGSTLIGFKVKVKPSTKYMFSFKSSSSVNMEVAAFETEPTVIQNSDTFIVNNKVSSQYFTTPSNCEWITCGFYTNGSGITISEFMLELGNIKTTYEPYGAVYGGHIDLIHGKIVAEYGKKVFVGTEADWSSSGDDWNTDNTGFCVPASVFSHVSFWNDYLKSNMLKKGSSYSLNRGEFYISNQSWANFRIRMTESMTLQEFKAFLSQNNLEIIYPLSTPIEYDLTPEQIKSLKGQNNIWSDLNGSIDVEYWAH